MARGTLHFGCPGALRRLRRLLGGGVAFGLLAGGALVLQGGAVSAQTVPVGRVLEQGNGKAVPASRHGEGPAEALEREVSGAVARTWHVDADRIVLTWGTYRGAPPDPGTPVEFLGSGTGGYWVVRFEAGNGNPAGVRVRAGVRVARTVAARRIRRGTVLQAADIATGEEVAWGAPEEATLEVRPGWVAQRVIKQGETLRPPAAQPALAVHAGAPVQLLWRRAGVGLRTSGRAVGSAPLGGEVFVRTESGDRLRGVVVAAGIVDVTRGS